MDQGLAVDLISHFPLPTAEPRTVVCELRMKVTGGTAGPQVRVL